MRFDDIIIGEGRPVGSHLFTEEEILDFAREYDPQPFHLSHEAAAASHFGRLCASGWHTAAIWMRLTVDEAAARGALAGISPGLDEIRWLKPVYAGDVITYENKVTDKRRLASRPGWVLVRTFCVGRNAAGDDVITLEGPVFMPIED